MKVIDLLNKIANGEEVPKKIRFDNKEWNMEYGEENVFYIDDTDNDLFIHFFRKNTIFTLNDEVEIIGEDNKIEKLDELIEIKSEDKIGSLVYEISCMQRKINEIIDKLNSMEK